jgi:hypothetical protein
MAKNERGAWQGVNDEYVAKNHCQIMSCRRRTRTQGKLIDVEEDR